MLDTACARVQLAQNGTPASLEEVRHEIQRIESEMEMLRRDQATGPQHGKRSRAVAPESLAADLARRVARRSELEQQWQRTAAGGKGMRRMVVSAMAPDRAGSPV